MKKEKLSKYFKLATVLLINFLPIWFLVILSNAQDFVMGLFYLISFNLWALFIHYFTKWIKRLWVRNLTFYILLLLFLLDPSFFVNIIMIN